MTKIIAVCSTCNPILRRLVIPALEDVSFSHSTPLSLSHPWWTSPHQHGGTQGLSLLHLYCTLNGGSPGMSVVIMTGSWDKTLKSWDLSTCGVLKTFDGHEDRVLSVSLSPNGVYAASGSEDKTVR